MAREHGRVTVFKLDDLDGALQDISGTFRSASGLLGTSQRPTTTTFGEVAHRREVLGHRDGGPISLGGVWKAVTSKIHGRQLKVLTDEFAVEGDFNNFSLRRSIDLPPTTTFGENWVRREVVGFRDGSLSLAGLFNSAANKSDALFRDYLSVATAPIFSVGYAGFAIGALVDLVQAVQGRYGIESQMEGVVGVSGDFEFEDRVDLGVSLHDLTAETTGDDTIEYASVDEAEASADGGVGHLHVTAFSGFTSATVKIQDSADDAAWADLITFTAATGVTFQRATVSGAVDRYVRAVVTTVGASGSVTFQVSFGRYGFAYGTAGTYRHFCGLVAKAATSSFEYGPEGGTGGDRKLSGECRLSSLETSVPLEGIIEFTAELMTDSTVSEGTF